MHCFMDGRDTPPNSGRDFVRQLQQKMRELGVGEIATVVGRYYAMDRDNRWERVELAYRALAHGEAETQEQRSRCGAAKQLRAGRDRRIREAGGDYAWRRPVRPSRGPDSRR